MKLLHVTLMSIFLFSCNTKSNESKVKLPKYYEIKDEEQFEPFLLKFGRDSIFQINHIKFPILSINETENNKPIQNYIQQKDWGFFDLSKLKKPKYIQTLKKISDFEYQVIFQVEDTGVYIIYTFKKNANLWMLTQITDESD